jgi:GntR family transcriptional regulator
LLRADGRRGAALATSTLETVGPMKIIISNSSPDPIYEQITRQVKAQIISGDLSQGDPLPSIRRLAHDLQISVITTKRAYDELEREGFIDTVEGKGSFVAMQNKELLREKKMKLVEDKLNEAVEEAKLLGISLPELERMLTLLYKERA